MKVRDGNQQSNKPQVKQTDTDAEAAEKRRIAAGGAQATVGVTTDQAMSGTGVAAPAATGVGQVMDFEQDAGAGTEGADNDSYAIPFLVVLQPLSPAVVDGLVKGAKPGMLMNSVTQELYGTEDPDRPNVIKIDMVLIPCAFQRRWIRWTPREKGGGFKGEFTTTEVAGIRERGEVKEVDGRLYYPLADGSVNEKASDRLSDTRSHFVLALQSATADTAIPMVFALTSSGIKTSKNFLSRIDSIKLKRSDGSLFTPPSFSHYYTVSTVFKKNEKGAWWMPEVGAGGRLQMAPRDVSLYAMAKAFNQRVTAGKVVVAHESLVQDTSEGEDGKGF